MRTCASSFEVEPLAPDRSRERISIFLAPEAASGERYARNRRAVFDMWEDLNREDIALLEGLQRGRAAPAYDGGVLSPYWDEAPRALARTLARTMREEAIPKPGHARVPLPIRHASPPESP